VNGLTPPPPPAPLPPVAPPRTWRFPTPHRRTLANGLTVLVYDLPMRPIATAELVLDLPLCAEPTGWDGVATIAVRALDEGTTSQDAESFAEELDRRGATLRTEARHGGLHLGLDAPVWHLEDTLALLAEAVQTPTFPRWEIDRLVHERLDQIAQERAHPPRRALQEFMAAAFDGRFGRPVGGSTDTVARLDAQAVAAFWRAHISPDRGGLVLAGDFRVLDLETIVEHQFAGWQPEQAHVVEPETPIPRPGPRVVLVDRPGSVQTQLVLGLAGPDRHDPAWAPLTVASHTLGGTLTARIDSVLREERGYTYGLRARFDPSRRGGVFTIFGSVHTAVTGPALDELRMIIDRFLAHGIRVEERNAAVDFLTRVAPMRYEGARAVAAEAASVLAGDLPETFIDANLDRIRSCTAEQATAAFFSRVRPEDFILAAVGDASRVLDALRAAGLGEVTVVCP